MTIATSYRCAVLSVAKHDYVAQGVAAHPRFELVVVADDPDVPDWVHERNQIFADHHRIPYVRDVDKALREHQVQVAIVSSEAERHCELSIRAAMAGLHIIQDKPMSTRLSECDRLVEAIEHSGVRFLMWNRNGLPSIQQASRQIASGAIGRPIAVHIDFYFAKDCGPPKGSRKPGYPPMNWLDHQIASHVDGSDGGLGREPMGEMAIEGIYPLGYIQTLTRADVHRVFARATAHFHQLYCDNNVEDLASITLQMTDGLIATMAIGRIGLASHHSGGEIKLHILGTEGALVINESRPDIGVYYRGQPAREPRRRRLANENDFYLADHFGNAIDNGSPTLMDARKSREIFKVFAAAAESCRTGQPVEVR